MFLCNFGEYGSKLLTGAQVLRWRFQYGEKLESIKPVFQPSDLTLDEITNYTVNVSKNELVKLFYGSNSGIDCALPLQYMDFLQSKGINTRLLYSCAVMDCRTNAWQLLPLCFEAWEEIEKISLLEI